MREQNASPPPPPPSDDPRARDELAARGQRRALGVLALLAAVLLFKIAAPVGVGLFFGMLAGFTLTPVYEALRRVLPRRFDAAAVITVTLTVAAIGGTLTALGYLLVSRGVALAPRAVAAARPGGPLRAALDDVSHRLQAWHVPSGQVTNRLGDAASDATGKVAGAASALAGATFSFLLGLFFFALAMHFTLGRWDRVVVHLQRLLPIAPRHTYRLMSDLRRVGRNVLLGTVVTGIAQGTLAGIGYKITGVPEAAFLGALTTVAATLPVVGTMVVWVPVGVFLIATGHTGHGVAELVFGALIVVGLSDYVIRPTLVGDTENTPTVATFVALFGGVEIFGLSGLVLGPVLVELALSVLRLWEDERKGADGGTHEPAQLPAHVEHRDDPRNDGDPGLPAGLRPAR